jgi:glycosyltransferase involved in cell wall biosynthesis
MPHSCIHKKYTVVHVIPQLTRGGAERIVTTLAEHCDKEQYRIECVTLYGHNFDQHGDRLKSLGIDVHALDKRVGVDLTIPWKLAKLLRRLRPDVIHTHLSALQYVVAAMPFFKGCAVVHTLHNLADREVPRLTQLLHMIAFKCGVQPVSIANAVTKSVVAVYGRQPAAQIENGIVLAEYRPRIDKQAARRKLDLPSNNFICVVLGRLNEQKRPDFVLDAFLTSVGERQDATLLFVGDGPMRERLQHRLDQTPHVCEVKFCGHRHDVPQLLASSDVFLLGSGWEGYPLSVMEAMTAGVVPVCTAVGGVPEMISHGVDGFVVEPGAQSEFTLAISILAYDRKRLGQMSQNASDRASQNFDHMRMVREYQALYSRARGTSSSL